MYNRNIFRKRASQDFHSLLASGQKFFKGLTFIETDFSKGRIGGANGLKGVVFDSCEFHTDFFGLDFNGVVFKDCTFGECRFNDCSLIGAVIGVRGTSYNTFKGCLFDGGANLGTAGSDYNRCVFKGSVLKGNVGVHFTECSFEGMNMNSTTWDDECGGMNSLKDCTLRGATFKGSEFDCFDSMTNVSFANATFESTYWGEAMCDRVSFVGATFKGNTNIHIYPEGKVSFANADLGHKFFLKSDSDHLNLFSFKGAKVGEAAVIKGRSLPTQSVLNFK